MARPPGTPAENRQRAFARRKALEEASPEEVRVRAFTVPTLHRRRYLDACLGNASPRNAILAKCRECCGYEDLESRANGCQIRACPLWPYRPGA